MLSVWDFRNRSNDDDGADTPLAYNCLISKPTYVQQVASLVSRKDLVELKVWEKILPNQECDDR